MKRVLLHSVSALVLMAAASLLVYGQGSSTSSLSGAVTDQTGAVLAGANVVVKNNATSEEFRAATASNGTFSIPVLVTGTYTVTISAQGFKQAVVNEVKLDAGVAGSVRIEMEVGATNESVVVQGGGEVLQTQSANIATTLNVNQIASLPLISRNPINFIVLLPGVTTPTDNRNSIVNGLPEAAIDITLDGINIQDNFNKTTDGLFARVAPSLDSVQEVTISTATPDAVGGGLGGVQVKFVTRQGTNEFHGSLYEYHRNPVLNSNYWFNNRDQAPDASTGKAPRPRVLFNQYGGRVGGPIWIPKLFDGRNKAFFFVNYEEFKQPTQVNRQRTILNPTTQQGIFQYNSSTGVRQVNLLTLAANNNQTSTVDPVIGKLFTDIRNATNGVGGITQLTDPNFQRFTYSPSGSTFNQRPTVRFDVNMTEKHHLELSWTYFRGRGGPDFLNNVEPAFPGFPNEGSQPADRYTGSLGVRSTLSPTLVNEARAGLSGGPSRFNPSATAGSFSGTVANQNGFALNINNAIGNGLTNPYVVTAPSRRNPLFRTIGDTLTWTRGSHSLSFGGIYTEVKLTYNAGTLVPIINFGVNTNDPANAMFVASNFQGASATDITNARNIYAVLTGRVVAINANARLIEEDGQYKYLGNAFERSRQRELGIFAQDAWRIRPNLTLNYGLRWDAQGSFTPNNSSYTTVSLNDLWGVSGPGNLFKPGTLSGRTTQFTQFQKGEESYAADYKNFAPNFGFAWSPNFKGGWLKWLAGEGGQTVVRGGYSMSYSRFGIGDFRGTLSANPGIIITTNRDLTVGNLVGGNLGSLPLLFRETGRLGPPSFPDKPAYPLIAGTSAAPITASANIYDPNLKTPYIQSWSFGIQREINRDTAIEVRYVGTRYLRGWTAYDLNDNENNITENGMLNEFKLAQANLQANIAAGRGNTFRYFGPGTGTSPLPITLAYFSGVPAAQAGDQARYTSNQFTSATFVNPLALNNPAPITFSDNLHSDAGRRANALTAGLPANFFLTNPDLRGGANFTGNGGYTRFDALQIDLRRRLSQGLLVQANYQFAKGFSSSRVSFRTDRINALNTVNLAHAFKVNWVYELPIGRGKMLFGNAGRVLDRIIGGWEFDGAGRVQSGQILNYGNVNLVGMTMKDLQEAFKLRFDDANKVIYALPQDIIDNTIRAFNVSATSATGYGDRGAPTGRYIAPANSRNCIQVYSGQCAPQNTYVTGPRFTRFDLSAVKKVKITETLNFELRGEFLNAFNHVNFFGSTNLTNFTNANFGQITSAYADSSNTNDPGGRIVQIVARINF
ncbi:MAG TPA: carboxypeptidase-like regulatory domain-containing protein [Blastocatellia bacterium]|nr:carboxypeptidase-like regulatory domain-containing protein [Blastocatellia bacterium]